MSGRPHLVVEWEVTRACPLACAHCRVETQRFAHPAQLTTAEGRTFIAGLARAYPGAALILPGGEPLTRSDTLELAAYGTFLGLHMSLAVDVGRLLTPETCRAIRVAGVDRVSCSLHFPDADSCDRFAQSPGLHEGALVGVANLRDAGVFFQLHTCVMRWNAALLPQLHDLAVSVGAGAWEVSFLASAGRGAFLGDEELPPFEQERVVHWLDRLQCDSPIPVEQTCATMSSSCSSGNGFCFVSHIGDVRGCGSLALSVGNVRDRSFGELYADSPLFRAFRDPSRRGDGCRARAYAATGNPLTDQPASAYVPLQAVRRRGRQVAASSSSMTD